MDYKIKYLEMIQSVIRRMANNSFLVKGWSFTLVSALLALAAGSARLSVVCLALFPCLSFWLLDGFFLRQERLYRRLYQGATRLNSDEIDFSLDTAPYESEVDPWLAVCRSRTLLLFHGMVLSVIIVTLLLI